MSIFQKHCPECAAPNSTDAITCNCGYCFDPEALASADPSAYANQQDHLYRDYLEARIAQAEAELIVAREQANADPESTYKASGAVLAEQTLNALLAEMKHLSSRLSSAPPRRQPSAVVRPVANVPPIQAKVRITPVARPNAPLTPKALPKPTTSHKHAAPSSPPTASKAQIKPATKPQPPAVRAKSPGWRNALKVVAARKAATVSPPTERKQKAPAAVRPAAGSKNVVTALPRKPATPPPARPSATKAPPQIARPRVNGQSHPASPSVTSRPDESFRRIQAEKADAIARSKTAPTALPSPSSIKKPAPQRAPADIPPVTLQKQVSMHECPNCTASVPSDLTRCSCGYLLSSPGQEVPALALDATALAILTEGISSLPPNRRR